MIIFRVFALLVSINFSTTSKGSEFSLEKISETALEANSNISLGVEPLPVWKDNRLRQKLLSVVKWFFESYGTVSIVNYDSDWDFILSALSTDSHVAYKFIKVNESAETKELSEPAILFFKTPSSIVDFNRGVKFKKSYTSERFHFVVVCEELGFYDVVTADFDNYRSSILFYEYFLVVDELEDLASLWTLTWFSEETCRHPIMEKVNSYERNEWKDGVFKIEKNRNFHGCKILFTVFNYFPAASAVFDYDKNIYQFEGYNIEIVKGLARNLNFTYSFEHRKHMHAYVKDLLLMNSCLNINFINYAESHFMTRPYMFSYSYMAVPPGAEYDCYEKLLLPFDGFVWILIALTFLSAYFTIFILRFASKTTRDRFLGRQVTTPSLNIANIFFGVGLTKMPNRNFGRFLVMIFILYTLIIRTAWQGKMFEFMQSEMRKPEVKSVDEMVEKNYTFYMREDFKRFHEHSDLMQKATIATHDDYKFRDVMYGDIHDPSFRGGIIFSSQDSYRNARDSNGEILKRKLQEPFMWEACGMSFPRKNIMLEVFDNRTQLLTSAGIINHYMDHYKKLLDPDYYKKPLVLTKDYLDEIYEKSHNIGPKVLSMDQLEAGFVLFLVTLLLSSVVFVFEWLFTFVKLFVFESNLTAYFKQCQGEVKTKKNELIKIGWV